MVYRGETIPRQRSQILCSSVRAVYGDNSISDIPDYRRLIEFVVHRITEFQLGSYRPQPVSEIVERCRT